MLITAASWLWEDFYLFLLDTDETHMSNQNATSAYSHAFPSSHFPMIIPWNELCTKQYVEPWWIEQWQAVKFFFTRHTQSHSPPTHTLIHISLIDFRFHRQLIYLTKMELRLLCGNSILSIQMQTPRRYACTHIV